MHRFLDLSRLYIILFLRLDIQSRLIVLHHLHSSSVQLSPSSSSSLENVQNYFRTILYSLPP